MSKVIVLHQDEARLIQLATDRNREAQRKLYEKYSPKMLGVCRRYISDLHYAEDVMITAFMKVFVSLDSYGGKGSFEGWVRRIMVNECVDYIRVQKNIFKIDELKESTFTERNLTSEIEIFSVDDIQYMIDNLPEGCKAVFILYAVEGYKHSEIGDMLGISEGTSKSQFAHARKLLQNRINRLNNNENGTKH